MFKLPLHISSLESASMMLLGGNSAGQPSHQLQWPEEERDVLNCTQTNSKHLENPVLSKSHTCIRFGPNRTSVV